MFVMIDRLSSFYNNLNMLYMTLMMASPMVVMMIVAMPDMFPSRRLNMLLLLGSAVAFFGSFGLIRTQTTIDDTAFLRSDELPARVALGYLSEEGLRTNVFHLPVRGNGDGGIYTTAADMVSFWWALSAGRIVTPSTWELMTTATTRDASASALGSRMRLTKPVVVSGSNPAAPALVSAAWASARTSVSSSMMRMTSWPGPAATGSTT